MLSATTSAPSVQARFSRISSRCGRIDSSLSNMASDDPWAAWMRRLARSARAATRRLQEDANATVIARVPLHHVYAVILGRIVDDK